MWLDTSGGRPKDIRARRFNGEIVADCDPALRRALISSKSPIYRATYDCKQECCRDFDAEQRADADDRRKRKGKSKESEAGDNSDEIRSEFDDAEEEPEKFGDEDELDVEEQSKKRKRPTKATRSCNVILHVSASLLMFVICQANGPSKGGDQCG